MREFVLGTGNATISGTTTMNYVKPSAAPNVNLEMLRHWVGQSSSTTSSQCRITLAYASGSALVTSTSPTRLKIADPNTSVIIGGASGAAGTCGTNATTEPAGKVPVIEDVFNVLNGWLQIPTPPETIVLPAGFTSNYILATPANPANSTAGWSWGWIFREV